MVSGVVIFCAFASLVQSIAGQNCGCSCKSISIPSSGGALNIQAIGPIVPSGIAVATELGLSGDLDLSGALPYLSAVAFEGQFDTNGVAPVAYGCGDCVAITQEIGNPSGANPNLQPGSSKIISCGCDNSGSAPVSYGYGDCVTITQQIDGFRNCGSELLHIRNTKLQA